MMSWRWYFAFVLACFPVLATDPFSAPLPFWPDDDQAPIRGEVAQHYALNLASLRATLENAGQEGSDSFASLVLPRPDGQRESFRTYASPIMAPELAARFPEIRTYLVISQTTASRGRLDLTPQGFHAAISAPDGSWYLDPLFPGEPERVISYAGRNLARDGVALPTCLLETASTPDISANTSIEGGLLTYRCAIACTGEYAAYHGGTVPQALAAIVTALNRVNEIYERDLAIRMVLVANNETLIYLDGNTDPYTNSSGVSMLSQNQQVLNSQIGTDNYDIGHVFSTGGGGVASLGVVCTGSKARGVTGLAEPIGDPFYVDYVAHEMGHQWGAEHSFNGNASFCGGNRHPDHAYEPGSGSTIMSYAGICSPQNLQANSDGYFHGTSFDEMAAFSRSGAGSFCAVPLPSANTAPIADAGDSYVIPAHTAFELSGSAFDQEDITLLYCWEQFDKGPAAGPDVDDGLGPLVRSWFPSASPLRTVPRLADLLAGSSSVGELLPQTDRMLNFRLTVRDQSADGGGVGMDDMSLQVTTSAGPFQLIAPNQGFSWSAGDLRPVLWQVAATDLAPVSCAEVDLLLSLDGGLTYTEVVADHLPNNGEAMVTVPSLNSIQARLKVVCSDNIFFDISDLDFTVTSLACVTWEHWRESDAGVFLDRNGNGFTDILEIISCYFP